jgi:hypothetical protein
MLSIAVLAFAIGSYRCSVQEQAILVPRLLLPPAPDSHCQTGQRYCTYPIHAEHVRHRPLGLCAILTGRVVEETRAEYSLLSLQSPSIHKSAPSSVTHLQVSLHTDICLVTADSGQSVAVQATRLSDSGHWA